MQEQRVAAGTAALSGFTQSVGYLIAATGPFLIGLLHDLTAHGLKGRRAAYIENGSWAPTSARGMQKLLEPLNWETAADTVTLRSALRQGQQEDLERMAAQLAESVKA